MVDPMSRGKLLRLATELTQERVVARRLATGCLADASRLEVASNTDDVRGLMAIVALALHRWYSAVESMLERIERSLGTLPGGSNWHMELLEVAALEIRVALSLTPLTAASRTPSRRATATPPA